METVFFSWQADTPASNGRVFIERAVTEALKRVNEGVHIENAERDELILDRDTRGVAGQPPIVETILRKIDETAIFVPDMTFVGVRKDGRPTPNPNVLIEYGWALKGLGHARIVPVMNSAYGEPTIETMPFDMKHLRNPITYELPERASDRKREAEHIGLSKALEEAFRAVLEIKGLRNRTAVAPVPYTPAEPKSGPARFRPQGGALGVSESQSSFERPREVHMLEGSAIWLRVMPAFSQNRRWSTLDLRRYGSDDRFLLSPLLNSHGSFGCFRADDGFGMYSKGEEHRTARITFAFESGEVWGMDASLIDKLRLRPGETGRPGLPMKERELTAALGRYTDFLSLLGVQLPYRWVLGMEGIKGFGLCYPPSKGHSHPIPGPFGVCVADAVMEQGLIASAEIKGSELKPFFVKLFDKCGLIRPDYLDQIEAAV